MNTSPDRLSAIRAELPALRAAKESADHQLGGMRKRPSIIDMVLDLEAMVSEAEAHQYVVREQVNDLIVAQVRMDARLTTIERLLA